MNELKIKNYIIADYDIINRGIDSLLNEDEKHKLSEIRAKVQETLKNNKKIKKEMESRDWESLVKILDNVVKEKQYDSRLDEIWTTLKSRIHEKCKLKDLDQEIKKKIIDFIVDMYENGIFIMQKGELEDYYKKDNFGEEFSNITGKGIIAYKIAELSSTQGMDKYIEIEEYKKILSNILE